MARVQREGERAEKAIQAEQRAREERSQRYDRERQEERDEEEWEDTDMETHQYMASQVCRDDDVPKTIEHSDLFDLDDPSPEA